MTGAPIRFSNPTEIVGRIPRSAGVPPNPLFRRGSKPGVSQQ
jgi:hypothetical protein